LISEALPPGLLVPLTRPRWVGWLIWALLGIATLAVVFSALAIGLALTWSLALGFSLIPIHFFIQRRVQGLSRGRLLVIAPNLPWSLSFFSNESGLTDSIEVIVRRQWHHFFGLSLGLKLQNRPHNQSQTATVVVWKHGVTQQVFREVALQVARQIDLAGLDSKKGAA